ncbi:hypothetical protein G9X64_16920 [Rhizobium sophorae]|uniref:Uncharacterized protein n=1 Tax=Rhizobium sophorae TaxID=1535242 RepID=A0A7Y3S6R4_9HYPH|nr:hypothetical protein [Rhizobium sophorae]MBX4863345.1 hypothetical protein [Rhizobium bangladeshense]NNU38134.1 hypothetical protein [Rhizobium sophorae]
MEYLGRIAGVRIIKTENPDAEDPAILAGTALTAACRDRSAVTKPCQDGRGIAVE